MKHEGYIMEAIDLLMEYSAPKPKPKIWIKVLDIILTLTFLTAYFTAIIYLLVWIIQSISNG